MNFLLAVKSEDDVNMVSITFGRLLKIWAIYLSCKQEFTFLGTKTFGLCAGSPQDTVNCYFTAGLWVGKLQTGSNNNNRSATLWTLYLFSLVRLQHLAFSGML